jgi:hypothetical protein
MDAVFLQHAREGRLDLASSGPAEQKARSGLIAPGRLLMGQAFFDMPLAARG